MMAIEEILVVAPLHGIADGHIVLPSDIRQIFI
jgi:hypothetical protein